jgi:hypothetical protein
MMAKVIINTCFGGYGLSDAAVMRYAELKGITLYPETKNTGWKFTTYWLLDVESRVTDSEDNDAFYKMPIEERVAHNQRYSEETFSINDVTRDDATLVQVVEELGELAFGAHASLSVVEIPDDVEWEIEEYDGNEHIAEKHRTWR